MGNCQAAEAATVLIQHPGGRVERVYWSLSASEVMGANPGHYVAVIITSAPRGGNSNGSKVAAPVKHLKLLRPDDTLHIGHVYRLVSFEEVLREFASKKHVKLSRFLRAHEKKDRPKRGGGVGGSGGRAAEAERSPATETVVEEPVAVEAEEMQWTGISGGGRRSGWVATRPGQWRPALQSIAEAGS